jgi:hypothetical protein
MTTNNTTAPRNGDWCQTFTGRAFWPLDPRPEDVCIEDIAHSLALQCRFMGHCSSFYSVAQHCYAVSEIVDPRFALHGLLHDATEAYVGDMPRPLKGQPEMAAYKAAERKIAEVIALAFGLTWTDEARAAVKLADLTMLSTEARALMVWPPPRDWNAMPEPVTDGDIILRTRYPWDPWHAEQAFFVRVEELAGR